jgi:hypothetical protein
MNDAPKRFRIRIKSGEHKGRYVGARIGGGLVNTPGLRDNPPVTPPGMQFSLYTHERPATEYVEGRTREIESGLRMLGYECELVEVSSGGSEPPMSFGDGIRAEALRAKGHYPGFGSVVDKVLADFKARQLKGDFQGRDWNMITEEFNEAVKRKCVKSRPSKVRKRRTK